MFFFQNSSLPLDPCNDFYDYVCSKDNRIITKLNFTNIFEDRDILKPNITFPSNGTYTPLDQILDPDRLMAWYSAINMVVTDSVDSDYFGEMSSGAKNNYLEKVLYALEKLETSNLTMTNVLYTALHANIEILKHLRLPITKENKFLHYMFDLMKENTIQEIRNSPLSGRSMAFLNLYLKDAKVLFAFLEYNNVTLLEDTKLVYETEYYRLRSLLSPGDLETEVAEKILSLGAINAAIKFMSERIPDYSPNFLFRSLLLNLESDAAQYISLIHVTVVTRSDLQQPVKAIADKLFVLAHELMHWVYPQGTWLMDSIVTRTAEKCARDEVKMMGDTDAVKPVDGWFSEEVTHEDLANIMAMRMVMKMAARKSANEKQLSLETIMSSLCVQGKPKNTVCRNHHPFELSLNTAVRQYPLFSSLYGCRAGDRMFAKREEFCKPLGGEVNLEDYKIKHETEDVG
ncbi:Peptidase_M13_N domain-containing protein [Caenorhabditis elegans]|uniref:Peptidase_M13_N domain-containing protein n=1 Tax=Caenorhabditis elegans TaxID=6239 RepID=O44472_CAEEL|nr:Peptidase_M13_N domain-containing protein [Caenorhabditis elegans]CCD69092.1 Peptidase_M13_N domain-containing protein [Caenorhabditis elegans]|eukprot:NP_500348.1 Uncharacterized protein CELE_F09D12.2 [Caenorhabditis elegans]